MTPRKQSGPPAKLRPSHKDRKPGERKLRKSRMAADRTKGMEREFRALELRKAGASFSTMAKEMGMSVAGARNCLIRAISWLEDACREEVPHVRRLELERLDAMILGLWGKARTGEPQAVERVLSIMRQRARFTPGLEVTPGIEIGGPGGGPIVTSSAEAGLLLQRFDSIAQAMTASATAPVLAGEQAKPAAALPENAVSFAAQLKAEDP